VILVDDDIINLHIRQQKLKSIEFIYTFHCMKMF